MRRPQRLIAAAVLIAFSGALGGLRQRFRQRIRSDRSARLARHQEEAAGQAQAGLPRGRSRPRAGRAEGSVQGRAQQQQDVPPVADRRRRPPPEPKAGRQEGQGQAARRDATRPRRPPRSMAKPRPTEEPAERRPRPSRRRSCASAPPRRRPIRNTPPAAGRRSPQPSRRSNRRRLSRRRCRAAPSRARFSCLIAFDMRSRKMRTG